MKVQFGLLTGLALAGATLSGQMRPALVEGQPVESRPTEKKDNAPAFPQQTRAPYHATAPFDVTTLIDNMHVPWSLAFLPSGRLLVTERLPGTMRILDTNGALSEPLAGVSVVKSPGAKDIGVLDVALDPDFASNRRLFFTFFEFVDGTDTNTYVARARLDEAKGALTDTTVIFRAVPAMPSKRLGAKTGGRIAIGRDGNLFVTIGDRSDSPPWDVAQKLDNHLGKILHITPDGAPAPDNPFIGKPGVLPEIWAYGVRSPEGLAFDPGSGRLWQNDHGPRGGDELNIIEKGRNYGWPVIVHGIDYPGTAIGEGVTHKEGMEEPVYYWDPVIAPSGLAFYTGNLFPEWKNSVFVGGLRGAMLDRLTIVNDKVVAEEPLLTDLHSRIRDVRVGPDGAVYVLTDSGTPTMSPDTPPTSKLLKLTPKSADARQQPATAGPAPQTAGGTRPPNPTRDPHTPGYVTAKELPDRAVPPADAYGNFIIGPTHNPAREMAVQEGVPHGTIHEFTMSSADSKIYPGIAREAGTRAEIDPTDPAKRIVKSHPAPYTRRVAVYIPQQYVPGTIVPFIVGGDGPDQMLFTALDNLIAQKRVPVMIAISIGNGSGDAQGSQRGLEYDTMSGRYAEFVETEVLPLVETQYNVKLSRDPDARATMGCSSGGSAALAMAWYRSDLYHRVLTYSGTYVNQQWPYNPQSPHGAWEFHEHLIPKSPAKPIRIWMHVGDRDNYSESDGMHDWVLANEHMARELAAKGYKYQFVFARNSGHCDRTVKEQTLPTALEWVWKGYSSAGAKSAR